MGGLRVLGFDPSLRNWGIACGTFDLVSGALSVRHLSVIQPTIPTGKTIRQNSKDLESAFQLYRDALAVALQAQAVFVEVPVGSQSARAMASYGMCVGVLGSLRASNIPFFEVTPLEVKMATVGNRTASKADMISWATSRFPDASWPYYTEHGQQLLSQAKAEHMADAIGAIVAGMQTPAFQQMKLLLSPTPTPTAPTTRSPHGNQTEAG